MVQEPTPVRRQCAPRRPERLTLVPRGGEPVEGWAAAIPTPGARPPRLLLVDDSATTDEDYAVPLAASGNSVLRVRSGELALSLLEREECDLVLLETQLPGMSGLQTCRLIREQIDIPIVFLAEQADVSERLLAFDLGADDFVLRPADPEELARRVRAVLRRARPLAGRDLLDGPAAITMHLRAHEVRIDGTPLPVTPREFALLRLFLERRGEVLTSDAISEAVWGYETFGSRNFVEAHVSRLRAKLASAGATDVITTIRGVGYVVR